MTLLKSLFICYLLLSAPLQQEIPYQVESRPLPQGSDFAKILPQKVGSFVRKDFTPPGDGTDGEATYVSGKDEVFMLFSLAASKADQRETMNTIYTEMKPHPTSEKPRVSLKSDPAYIYFIGPKMAFFAWTRGLYSFSADAKDGNLKTLNNFMQSFSY